MAVLSDTAREALASGHLAHLTTINPSPRHRASAAAQADRLDRLPQRRDRRGGRGRARHSGHRYGPGGRCGAQGASPCWMPQQDTAAMMSP